MFKLKEILCCFLLLSSLSSKAFSFNNVLLGEPSKSEILNADDDSLLTSLIVTSFNFTANPSDSIFFGFVKPVVSQSPDSAYFNVLKIKNYGVNRFRGLLNVYNPEGWSGFSLIPEEISLDPGDSISLPIRLILPNELIGGVAYVLGANLKTKKEEFTTNAYIKAPRNSNWSLSLNSNLAYFNEFEEYVKVEIRLVNAGNVKEVIKLSADIGKMLILNGGLQQTEYLILPPFSDTTIVYPFKYRIIKDEEESLALQKNWKANNVTFKADNGVKSFSDSFRVRKLPSYYTNQSSTGNTPLNIDFQVFNLLSEFTPRVNLMANGSILFENSQIGYFVSAFNVGFDPFSQNNWEQSTRFGFNYNNNFLEVRVGDNIGNNVLHNIFGRGASVKVRPLKNELFVGAAYTENIFQPVTGTNFSVGGKIKKVRLTATYTNEVNTFQNYTSNSVSLSGSASLFKNSGINFGVNVSNNQFSNLLERYQIFGANINDTTTTGYGYYITYGLNLRRFSLNLNRVDNLNNFHRSSGFATSTAIARYTVNAKSSFSAQYSETNVTQQRFPISFFTPEARNSFQMMQLNFNRNVNQRFTYRLGPTASLSERAIFNLFNNTLSEISNFNYGFQSQLSFRLTENLSVSPTLYVGNADIISRTLTENNELIQEFRNPNVFNTTTGLNIITKHLRLNVLYTLGPVNFLGFQTGTLNARAQTLMIRPYYERFVIQKFLKLSVISNFITQTPSNIENFSALARADFYLENGFRVYVGQNIFTTRRATGEQNNVITNRNYNMVVGVNKSFDFQQPRMSFYDLEMICFHDINGNGIKDDNEPPLANVMADIERINNDGDKRTNSYIQMQLISNPDGAMGYKRIPEGAYRIDFTPLVNLGNLYNVYGKNQEVIINNNTTIYVPFAESYAVRGEVKIIMAEFSNRTKPSLSGIRITAEGINGEMYSVLTGSTGEYTLNIPQGTRYNIKINNVLDEDFEITRDNYQVDFNGIKTFMLDFVFRERERKINFGNFSVDEDASLSDEEYFKQIRENGTDSENTKPNNNQNNFNIPETNSKPANQDGAANQDASQNTNNTQNTGNTASGENIANNAENLANNGNVENNNPAVNENLSNETNNQNTPNQVNNTDNQNTKNTEVDPFDELDKAVNQLIEQRTGEAPKEGSNQNQQNANGEPLSELNQLVETLIGENGKANNENTLEPANDYSGEFGAMEKLADQLLQQGNVIGDKGIQQGTPATGPQNGTQANANQAANTDQQAQNTNQNVTQQGQQAGSVAAQNAGGGVQSANNATNRAANETAVNELASENIPEGEEPANIRIAREAKAQDEINSKGILDSKTIPVELSANSLPSNINPSQVKFNVQTGIFAQEIPLRVHEKFLAIGFKARRTADGKTRYVAGDFDSIEEARNFRNQLQSLGFGDAFAVGSYGDVHLSAGQALELKK